MSAVFSPVWITPAGALASVTENDVVAVSLVVESVATVTLAPGQTSIEVGTSVIFRMRINGADYPFSASGSTITFTPLPYAAVATLTRRATPIYDLHEGTLPPGVGLLRSGALSGRVANIPSTSPVTYEFTVRATEGGKVRDRRFSIAATPAPTPLEWDTTGVPDEITTGGLTYRPLGVVPRGGAFGATFALSGGDATGFVSLTVSNVSVPGGFISGLPRGLRLVPGELRIEGVISTAAPTGTYVFAVGAVSPQAPDPLICSITVPTDVAGVVAPPVVVVWITPAGLIDSLREGDPSPLRLQANVIGGGQPITYLLADGVLPPGLELDPSSGDIRGLVGFINIDTDYNFVVRARAGATFVDRAFRIRVQSRYSTTEVINISLPAPRDAVVASGQYTSLIPSASVFRASDPNFGIPSRPHIYVAGGLNTTVPVIDAISGEGTPGIPRTDYHADFDLWFGPHRVVTVRDGSGAALYDVLLRTVIDPADGSGGFALDDTTPVDERVLYPQDARRDDPRYVYKNSVRNARLDLINDIGIAATDPALVRRVGPTGVERLPAWMRVDNKFSLAMPVAYLQPGAGEAVLAACDAVVGTILPANGRMFRVGGYVVETVELNTTTLDNEYSFLPFQLTPSQPSVNLGGWALQIEMVLRATGTEAPIVMQPGEYSISPSGIMTFMPMGVETVLIVVVRGVAPAIRARTITTTTSLIRIGPLISTFTNVLINGVETLDYRIVVDGLEFYDPLPANTELLIKTSSTTFDGVPGFDADISVIGKYQALPHTGGIG